MASTLQKLLKRSPSPPTRILTALTNPQSQILTKSFNFHNHVEPQNDHFFCTKFTPFLGSNKNDNLTNLKSSTFYPIFPFGYFLDPISSAGSTQCVSNDDASVGVGIWADSVKKKRKKKMNKHKYKKLRKRLSRQS
ncbi:DUF1713 domain-containing protein [Cephalotus follicularis]|uniref:Small ribosomal subunit protein mS38 n=1 Tax=Cephalotus follicularis TaxID=3775 RepID=A0A1Q3CXT4_CEPFO|nr:DUF1713 domain-containing protein [Cephalotus follicularis]